MLLGQYIKRNMPDAVELNDMISRPGEGYAISQMAVAPVDTGPCGCISRRMQMDPMVHIWRDA